MVNLKVDKYFPYAKWRRIQEAVADFVYSRLSEGVSAIVEAPTGAGKTASVLAPALAFAIDNGLKVIYLVRTNNQAASPIRELERLFRVKGVFIPYVLVRSRSRMCCIKSTSRLPYRDFLDECNYLKSTGKCPYYANLESRGIDKSQFFDVVADVKSPKGYVDALCRLNVCPYDASRLMVKEANVVILSYYYLFTLNAPEVVDIDLASSILIIDEAHNLPYSIIDLNTVKLDEYMVKLSTVDVKRFVNDSELKARALRDLALLRMMFKDLFKGISDVGEYRVDYGKVLEYFTDINDLKEAAMEVLVNKRRQGIVLAGTALTDIVDFYKAIVNAPKGRALFLSLTSEGKAIVSRLMDPSEASQPLNKAYAFVAMSGTMPPLALFKKFLGIERRVEELRIGLGDFIRPGNLKAVVYSGVTTRFTERSEEQFSRIAQALVRLYESVDKGVLAVFPSYEVLKSVRRHIGPNVDTIVELSTSTIEEVTEVIKANPHRLIMAVAGGKFVEGIEFRHGDVNYIEAIAIVGVPYPEPNDFMDMLVESIRSRMNYDDAWDAVFTWNAMVKVKQAIGRGIRSEDDRAFVVLMDYRFSANKGVWDELRSYIGDVEVYDSLDKVIEDLDKFRHVSKA